MSKKVYVCVGSSCHLKGSYDILQRIKQLIEEHHTDAELNASFCLGHCSEGVSVKIDETLHTGVTPENVDKFFTKYIATK